LIVSKKKKKIYQIVFLLNLLLAVIPASSQFQVNGNASQISCTCYTLTPDQFSQSGSVWNLNQIDLSNSFNFIFDVFLGCDDNGADGIAFVLQPVSTSVGSAGGGMGYQGISPSVGIVIDTYQNGGDPSYDHINIASNGDISHGNANELAPFVQASASSANIEDCAWHTLQVVWNAGSQKLDVYIDGVLRVSYTGNIVANIFGGDPNVYWGFTGATGGAKNLQQFCLSVTAKASTSFPSGCVGVPVQFTDSSYSTLGTINNWQWDFGDGASSTVQNPTHTYIAPGTYSVKLKITDASGCSDSTTSSITINPTPNATILTNGPFCNENVNIPLSAATSGGTWSGTGVSGNNFNPSVAGDGSITLSYTVTQNGCTSSSSKDVNVESVSITGAAVVSVSCNGLCDGKMTINASNNASDFSIDNGTTWQSSNVFQSLCAGNYNVKIKNTNNCKDSAVINVTQPTQLSVSVSTADATCNGTCNGNAILTPSGGTSPYTYIWSNGQTAQNSTTLCAGNYSVTIKDQNNCTKDTSFAITQPAAISYNLNSTNSNCGQPDGTASCSSPSGGNAPYSYLWSNGSTDFLATGLVNGTYKITVTDNNNCTKSDSVIVGYNPGPSVNVSSVQPTCYSGCDGSATANAFGGTTPGQYTYSWSNSQSGQTAIGLCAGNYTVTVSDGNFCQATASVTLTEPNVVTVAVTANPSTACIGKTSVITANASGGSNANFSYSWSNGKTSNSFSDTLYNSTTYTVTATDGNGCVSQPQSVTVNTYPPLSVSAYSDTTICENGTALVVAAAAGGNGGPYSYSWNNNAGNGSNVTVTPNTYPNAVVYVVTVSDGCSPNAKDSVTVSFFPTPAISFSADLSSGCVPLTVNFTNNNSSGTCFWNFGDGTTATSCTATYTYSNPGTYNLLVQTTSTDGCKADSLLSSYINAYPLPVANFYSTPEKSTKLNPVFLFTDSSTGAITSWQWTFTDTNGISTANSASVIHEFSGDTGYFPVMLLVTTQYGCSDSIVKYIRILEDFILYVPTAFSPNGDGTNDYFFPVISGADPNDFSFFIYDRWGELIFESFDFSGKWDGNISGNKAQQDIYIWTIKTKNKIDKAEIVKKGFVMLLRD
jgi:gliding motility-associated-like protein